MLSKSFVYVLNKSCYARRRLACTIAGYHYSPLLDSNGHNLIRNINGGPLARNLSTEAPEVKPSGHHNIIQQSEKPIGNLAKHEFQAETRMLLNIVARSLYSEKEVFVRELISNASDALEKFRYTILSAGEQQKDYEGPDRALEIRIATAKQSMLLTIQDTGIGMTREELVNNLGTIARSGSKKFLQQIQEKGRANENASNIIGQFGVGFYSVFMVADKVEVYTRSSKAGSPGLLWTSDGSGSYEIQEARDVALGTKILIYLKTEYREYSDEERIKSIIKKYSNFIGSPIFLNGQQVNDIKPIWLMDPKELTDEQHTNFYRFMCNTFDVPRFTLHYKTEVPLSIRALIYFPKGKPELFELSRELTAGVSLYTRKVLIQSKTSNLVPKWLRFVKGVVDSEDIPLNLSRELLQNSTLIKKLSDVLTSRILRFLHERASKQPEQYEEFYKDYGLFLKEGIVTSTNPQEKENIAKLLRFDFSGENKRISLEDYCKLMGEDQKEIFYLAAPNRILAESSPYYENLKKRSIPVIFCYEPYDEMVLMQLDTFKGKNLMSVEKEMRKDKSDESSIIDYGEGSLQRSQVDELLPWVTSTLSGKVAKTKVTTRLDTHPCAITVEEMAAARQFIRIHHETSEEGRFALLQPQLEINPKHPIIKKLHKLHKTEPVLSELIIKQLFANAMVSAGLTEDPRLMLSSINELLAKALEKY